MTDFFDEETIFSVLRYAIGQGASDVHFKTGLKPVVRVNGETRWTDFPPLSDEQIRTFARHTCPNGKIGEDRSKTADYSWEFEGIRFRCNAYHDLNGWCLSMRLLTIPQMSFEGLGIPPILKTLAEKKSGLILITGPTGSGKTTTLTCLIDYLNNRFSGHIITLEDPVEFVHHSKKSIISQREIGQDSPSYEQAVVEALREDPDVILIGEMREKESIASALRAAETGHLVLSTLHTKGAANTITRIIDVFPPEQQDQIRMQLSMSLLGVVSQQLLPKKDKSGRVLATEVMVASLAVQNLIRTQKVHMIPTTLQISSKEGMYTMRHSLEELLKQGLISQEDFENYQIM